MKNSVMQFQKSLMNLWMEFTWNVTKSMCIFLLDGKDKSLWFSSFLHPKIGSVGRLGAFCFLEISQLNEFCLYPVAFGGFGGGVVWNAVRDFITFFSFEDFV